MNRKKLEFLRDESWERRHDNQLGVIWHFFNELINDILEDDSTDKPTAPTPEEVVEALRKFDALEVVPFEWPYPMGRVLADAVKELAWALRPYGKGEATEQGGRTEKVLSIARAIGEME